MTLLLCSRFRTHDTDRPPLGCCERTSIDVWCGSLALAVDGLPIPSASHLGWRIIGIGDDYARCRGRGALAWILRRIWCVGRGCSTDHPWPNLGLSTALNRRDQDGRANYHCSVKFVHIVLRWLAVADQRFADCSRQERQSLPLSAQTISACRPRFANKRFWRREKSVIEL